jgi:threonine dehydrogenase-like Zn-dependent dehydrogenase
VRVHDLQIVPRGIDAIDAIFLPSVETALSLVHDANPRFGERVVVFGQGIIGLLTTGILRQMSSDPTSAGKITTVDLIPSRLAASARFGSSEALLPSGIKESESFDVAIEVSGNEKALQQAIEVTREGGAVIVGSWYGKRCVPLMLGTDFHRSHIVIKASQVSEIPAELRFRWTKARRFALAWELLRALRPSRLITRVASLDEAQDVYEALNHGKEIAVAFEYSR